MGKGSRQTRSVTSEKGLALRAGLCRAKPIVSRRKVAVVAQECAGYQVKRLIAWTSSASPASSAKQFVTVWLQGLRG